MESPMFSALIAFGSASFALMIILLRAWRKLDNAEFINAVNVLALDFAAEQIAALKCCDKDAVIQDLIASGVYGYHQYDPDVFVALSRPIFTQQRKALENAVARERVEGRGQGAESRRF
jgi:hypothetical protein